MSEHARLSFSASDRWIGCPASVEMSRDLREGEPSAASIEGTVAHKVFERSLQIYSLTGDDKISSLSDPEEMQGYDFEEMAKHLQPCMDYVIQRYKELPGRNKGIALEQRVDLHYMTNRDDLWGTSDCQIWSDTYLDTLDLKYGKGIFVPADTSQNRLYTLGKMCEFMKKSKGDVPWISVRSTILQPRFPDENGEIIRFQDFDPQDLMDWFHEKVMPMVEQTDNPPAPIPGEKQCRWCLAKPTCPAARKEVIDLLGVFEDQRVHTPETLPALPEGDLLTDENVTDLIMVHDRIPFIEGYLKAVSQKIRELVKARDPRLHGKLKLVVSRRTNSWEDGLDIKGELAAGKGKTVKEGYIPYKKLFVEKPISAAQALKLKLNKQQKEKLQSHITKSEGSLTIVPWSDPRDNAFPDIPFEKVASTQPYDFL